MAGAGVRVRQTLSCSVSGSVEPCLTGRSAGAATLRRISLTVTGSHGLPPIVYKHRRPAQMKIHRLSPTKVNISQQTYMTSATFFVSLAAAITREVCCFICWCWHHRVRVARDQRRRPLPGSHGHGRRTQHAAGRRTRHGRYGSESTARVLVARSSQTTPADRAQNFTVYKMGVTSERRWRVSARPTTTSPTPPPPRSVTSFPP